MAAPHSNSFNRRDELTHSGIRRLTCDICDSVYPVSELVHRNGTLVCTTTRWRTKPCFDETGFKETVTTSPLRLGPRPDVGRFGGLLSR